MNGQRRCDTVYIKEHYLNKRNIESEGESHSVVPSSLRHHGLYSQWNSPSQKTGVGSLSLLQWIIPTQESNRGLLHYRQILYRATREYYSVIKKNDVNRSNMGRLRDYHTKWSKDRYKHHIISLICGILKNDGNELIHKTEIDSQTQKTNLQSPKSNGGEG